MANFLDVCRFNPTAGSTTDWTYSTAVTGYQSPSAAGAATGALYRYRAESNDLSQWEVGFGTWNGTVLTRTTVLFNSSGTTSKINFSTVPQIAIVALAEDIGGLTGIRLAKTAAYTAAQADANNTIALGGAAFYQLTFPAASGFVAPWKARVLNEDIGRGKRIVGVYTTSATSLVIGTGTKAFTVASGLDFAGFGRWRAYSLANPANFMSGVVASYATTTLTLTVDTIGGSGTLTDWQIAFEFILWPRQSITIENQNNVWQAYDRRRYLIRAPLNIYVDTGGNNANDGLASGAGGALSTITAAVEMLYEQIDGGGYTVNGVANARAVTIQVTTSQNFTESISVIGQPVGLNAFTIKGNGGAPTWNSTTFGISVGDNAEVILDTISWNCNTSNSASTGAVMGHNNAVVDFVGSHLFIGNGANCSAYFTDSAAYSSISNGFTVSGTFGDVVHMNGGGQLTFSGALAPSGTTNTTRAYYLNGGAQLYIGTQMTLAGWTTMGASVANFCSCIHLNGTTIQGGTGVSFGGQVA